MPLRIWARLVAFKGPQGFLRLTLASTDQTRMLKQPRGYRRKRTISFLKRTLILTGKMVGGLILTAIAVGIFIGVAVPIWQAIQLHSQGTLGLYEVINAVHPLMLEALKAVLPGLGGIAACVAAFAAIRNWKAAEDRQAAELFIKAAEMLAGGSLEARSAGVHSLDRIAKSSLKDHWTVMELLMTFVRGRPARSRAGEIPKGALGGSSWQRWSDPAAPDIGAALGVISQRSIIEGKKLKLHLANLGGVTFEEKANFQGADLREANLYQASLPGAIFRGASLVWADLRFASLLGVDFTDADLRNADLRSAELARAIFKGADLAGAVFDMRNKDIRVDQIIKAKNWRLAVYGSEFSKQLAERDEEFRNKLEQQQALEET